MEEKIDDDDVLDAIEKLNAKISASLDNKKKEKNLIPFFCWVGLKAGKTHSPLTIQQMQKKTKV